MNATLPTSELIADADRVNQHFATQNPDLAAVADRTTGTCQCGKPAHEIRTGDTGHKYGVCFSCAQDWQAVLVRKEDVPQVAELGRSLYIGAARQVGYVVEDTREADASETFALNVDQLYAALPSAVDEAMRSAVPEHYTSEVAAEIAAGMVALLRENRRQRPLTAAQRGQEWMNKFGCPGWCVENHGQPEALDCHSTAPVETSLKAAEVDSSGYSANGEQLPWMTAQVVQHTDETAVWLGYGVHLAELSPAEARQALDSMRAFVTRLSAVVDFADQVAGGAR